MPSPISSNKLKAVAFDAYGTLFDVYSVSSKAEQLFPGQGAALSTLWREKQIEYTRLRTLSDLHGARHYKPFWAITQDALRYSASRLGLALSEAAEKQLMAEYACLSAFPENLPTLKALHEHGVPLAILSNGNREMLDIAVKSAGMSGLFTHILSVDAVRRFKTAPEAYQMGVEAFGLCAEEILFVSSNGWDAACATWFGYTTLWVNRAGLPLEALDVQPHYIGHSLKDIRPLFF